MGQETEGLLDSEWSIFDLPDESREAIVAMLNYPGGFPDAKIAEMYEVAEEVAQKQIDKDRQAVRERVMGKISLAWLDNKLVS